MPLLCLIYLMHLVISGNHAGKTFEKVTACPAPGALHFTIGRRAVSPLVVGALTLSIFLGSYGIAKATGAWISKGSGTTGEKAKKVSLVLPAAHMKKIISLES